MKFVIIYLSFSFIWLSSFGQKIKYNDLLDLRNIPDSINPNDSINCERYFKLDEMVHKDGWGHKYQALPEIIGGYDSIFNLIHYPVSKFRCGKNDCTAFIRFIIDKNGNIFCYEILTTLPQEFINEIEKIIPLIKFTPAIQNDKTPIPCDVLYKYDFKKTVKQKKK